MKSDIISAVRLCVCNKNSCAPFKCERSARNPTTKQGVRVCVEEVLGEMLNSSSASFLWPTHVRD